MYVPPTSDARLRRIEALLAKAEASTFPAEAEAFLAKAQELMARHAIDAALLHRSGAAPRGPVRRLTVDVPAPYATARSHLLGAVARNNGCRVVVGRGLDQGRSCHVFGHDRDVANVVQLYGLLSAQATRAVLAVPADRRVRSFRHAFHLAYAARIDERLRAATRAATERAERDRGSSVALAVRDRRDAVERAVAEAFPLLGTVRTSSSSVAGLVSGRAAADRASVGRLEVSSPPPLPRGSSRS